jgi:hypothetical protein
MELNIWSTVDTETLADNIVDRMTDPEIQGFVLAIDSKVGSIDFTLELIHQLIDSLEIDGTIIVRNTKPVRLDCVEEPTKEDIKYDDQPFPQDTDCCSWGE